MGIITRMKNVLRGFRKPTYRITVSWEHERDSRMSEPDCRPCNYNFAIAGWCLENSQHRIRVRRYAHEGSLVSRNNISTMVDPQSIDFLYSNSYSYFSGSTLINFLDLEFDDEDDFTLFKLAWVGRVKIVTEIPFMGHRRGAIRGVIG